MSNDWFFEKFSLIADAPGAVERMRGLVLDWALSGKFSQKSEVPFKYVRLDSVADIRMGNSPPGHSYNETGQGVPLINGPVEFSSGPLGLTVRTKFTTSPTKLCKRGDLLICVRGSTTGRTNIAAFDACIGRGVAAITAHDNQIYINLFVWSQRAKIFALGTGSTFPSISYDDLASLELTLPPLAEQKRIVAKVEELMGICDALESQQQERESRKSVLVRASLSRFAESPTPENLGYLFHKSYDIPPSELRKSILTLAVQGKLVPQDPNDEPSDLMLERLDRGLTLEQRRRQADPLSPIAEDEIQFEAPANWKWARFRDVAIIASNLVKPNDFLHFIHLAPDNIEKGNGVLLSCKTVREDKVISSNHRFYPGQIVYSKIRPNLAKVVVVDFEGLCSADMYPIDAIIDPFYLQRFMLSEIFLVQAVKNDTRVAMPKINQMELNSIAVPVPPLAEQHRIVAKVDQLMALVDELERQQVASREKASKLLDAIVQEMTSGGRDIAATLES